MTKELCPTSQYS